MRRADRLFRIVQTLRRRRRAMTAAEIAETLEVSVRTVYRDIVDLVASGVPIDGAAGVGYLLRQGYDLPPLMFTVDEVESIVLGARIVESWSDKALAEAARSVLAKLEAVLPSHLADLVESSGLCAPVEHFQQPVFVDMAALRRAVRTRAKLRVAYRDVQGQDSLRVVWPLGLAFYGPCWLLLAWCELREDFRSFRADRILAAEPYGEVYPIEAGRRLVDYQRIVAERDAERRARVAAGETNRPAAAE